MLIWAYVDLSICWFGVVLQFKAYMTLIKEMIERVETEHHSKLEQLEQMKQEQK